MACRCDERYLVIGTNTGYVRVVRMPTEEEDTPERHYMVWMMAQQKLLKKLKGRRLAKEEVYTQLFNNVKFMPSENQTI